MKKLFILLVPIAFFSCRDSQKATEKSIVLWEPYNDSAEVAANQNHEVERMRYQLIQSKVLDKNAVFLPLYPEVSQLSEAEYSSLKPLLLEQDIYHIRTLIQDDKLTYEKLVLFYLYRIYKYELDNSTTLNTVIALNEHVVGQARKLDEMKANGTEPGIRHPIYGMPILLKDNINTKGMLTTAGAIALMDNEVEDAFIVKRLKENGALILGKVNLSEWAYFLCEGCPVGYSAIGGQTLNPYGRRIFETGGSSSGSGTSMAANYAAAAVGTETSGSILSPSGQNSVVGLKPTVGLLSRSGIIPISSTLDTPGPMTRNVRDNAILLSAMLGKDTTDTASVAFEDGFMSAPLTDNSLKGKRFGVFQKLLETDSVYRSTVQLIMEEGAEIIEFTPPETPLEGFLTLLNIDMKNDLPAYLERYIETDRINIRSVADVVAFNASDSLTRIPYGQKLFRGILVDTTNTKGLDQIKQRLQKTGRAYFDGAMDAHKLDAVLSINNYHAGYAAVAQYPALTVPMGYTANGEPMNLTFIGKPFTEAHLLRLGSGFEAVSTARKMPKEYE